MVAIAIQGFVDRIDDRTVSGWARLITNDGPPVIVQLWNGTSLIASKVANSARSDAVGRSGFAFTEGAPFELAQFESGSWRVVAQSGDISQPIGVWAGVRSRQERIRRERLAANGRLVVLVGKQRSGTTAIGRIIASHPGAFYAGEVFHSVRGPQDDLEYKKYLTVPEVNFFAWREGLFGRFPSLSYPSASQSKGDMAGIYRVPNVSLAGKNGRAGYQAQLPPPYEYDLAQSP